MSHGDSPKSTSVSPSPSNHTTRIVMAQVRGAQTDSLSPMCQLPKSLQPLVEMQAVIPSILLSFQGAEPQNGK